MMHAGRRRLPRVLLAIALVLASGVSPARPETSTGVIAVTLDQAKIARLPTGATTLIMPVVRIDGREIGAGIPGPVASKLRAIFHDAAARSS